MLAPRTSTPRSRWLQPTMPCAPKGLPSRHLPLRSGHIPRHITILEITHAFKSCVN